LYSINWTEFDQWTKRVAYWSCISLSLVGISALIHKEFGLFSTDVAHKEFGLTNTDVIPVDVVRRGVSTYNVKFFPVCIDSKEYLALTQIPYQDPSFSDDRKQSVIKSQDYLIIIPNQDPMGAPIPCPLVLPVVPDKGEPP
jgi:hypothetical protein